MFKKVLATPGFWKSVIVLGMIYMSVLMLVQWALLGFAMEFFTGRSPWTILLVFVIGSFVCGFSVSYARIWVKLKREQSRQ